MKLLNFIMKLFGTIIGVITAVYVVALYMDLTLRFGSTINVKYFFSYLNPK